MVDPNLEDDLELFLKDGVVLEEELSMLILDLLGNGVEQEWLTLDLVVAVVVKFMVKVVVMILVDMPSVVLGVLVLY